MHDKIIPSDAALLVQKKTRCGRVSLNKALNSYGATKLLNIRNYYIAIGDQVFQQIIDIPMGSDPPPFFINLCFILL